MGRQWSQFIGTIGLAWTGSRGHRYILTAAEFFGLEFARSRIFQPGGQDANRRARQHLAHQSKLLRQHDHPSHPRADDSLARECVCADRAYAATDSPRMKFRLMLFPPRAAATGISYAAA